MGEQYIDLHTHSLFSDGYKTISELLDMAKDNNVFTFAITDHDDIRSYEILKVLAKKYGIRVISGIELSTYYKNPTDNKPVKIHLLGYGIDIYNSTLLQQLSDYRNLRYKDNIQMLNNLLNAGIYVPNCIFDEVKFDNYLSIVSEMKRVLVKNDYDYEFVSSFVHSIKPYVPKYENYEIDIFKGMELIKESGGVPVLAHPHEIKMSFEDKDILVKLLSKNGLKAVEVFCSEASPEEVIENKRLTENNKLLISVGSDYHRPDKQNKTIGKGIDNNLCKSSCSFVDYLEKENMLIK